MTSRVSFAWTTTCINPIIDPGARGRRPSERPGAACGRCRSLSRGSEGHRKLMSASDKSGQDGQLPPDLMTAIRRSGNLSDRQYRAILADIETGEYPADPESLAGRLVREGILTPFQAKRLLQNK